LQQQTQANVQTMQGGPGSSQTGPGQAPAGSYQQQAYGAYQAPSGALFLFLSVLFLYSYVIHLITVSRVAPPSRKPERVGTVAPSFRAFPSFIVSSTVSISKVTTAASPRAEYQGTSRKAVTASRRTATEHPPPLLPRTAPTTKTRLRVSIDCCD
jgi:hypothetical protein